MRLAPRLNDVLVGFVNVERRVDPYFRRQFDAAFRAPLVALVQAIINRRRRNEPVLALAEERLLPGEEGITAKIIETQSRFVRQTYAHARPALRAGNTKTHGVVRGEFEVLPGLAPNLRHGVFSEPKTYRAWVRFGGPGPLAPPDLKDNGLLSIGIKLMGVPGEKLFDDEKWTQDFTGITAPTFTTPNIVENVRLQQHVLAGTPLFYFVGLRHPHLLDALMQGLYAKTQLNPLEERYWSCVPYLLGKGQAMQYSVIPRMPPRTRFPRRPPPNYLREAMVKTLAEGDVEFDFAVQIQVDPFRMPIENASVVWPERLSPYTPVARLRIPAQTFDSAAQLAFADNLAYNPWHSVPEHRPLGNQGRARKAIYYELSRVRQTMNGTPRTEPTGEEVFA